MQNNDNKYSLLDKWGKLCIFYKKTLPMHLPFKGVPRASSSTRNESL
jgi:hypothetical protein